MPKLASDEVPITPYRVIWEFMHTVDPRDAIVTHDSGSPRDQLLPFYRATAPRSYLGWGKSHALGTGLGLIIGAKLAAPDKFCVNFMGDAAFGMTGLDFETAVRCGIPITDRRAQQLGHGDRDATHLVVSHERYRHARHRRQLRRPGARHGRLAERVEKPEEIVPAIRARAPAQRGRHAPCCSSSSPARRSTSHIGEPFRTLSPPHSRPHSGRVR